MATRHNYFIKKLIPQSERIYMESIQLKVWVNFMEYITWKAYNSKYGDISQPFPQRKKKKMSD